MNWTYRDWIKHLDQGSLPLITLVQIQEPRLWDFMQAALRESVRATGNLDFNFEILSVENLTREALLTSLETLPLMNTHRVVIIKDLPVRKDQLKANEELFQTLVAYVDQPNETTRLYLSFQDKAYAGKAFKKIRERGQMVVLARLNPVELRGFIGKTLRRLGVKADRATLAFLAQISGYLDRNAQVNLYDVENMTAKAAGAAIDGVLTQAEAEKVLIDRKEENIFALLDGLGDRRREACLRSWQSYQESGGDAYRLYAMIRRQVRLMNGLAFLQGQGRSAAETQKILGIHPFENKKLYRQTSNFHRSELHAMHEQIFKLEVEDRTGQGKMADGLLIFLARWSSRAGS